MKRHDAIIIREEPLERHTSRDQANMDLARKIVDAIVTPPDSEWTITGIDYESQISALHPISWGNWSVLGIYPDRKPHSNEYIWMLPGSGDERDNPWYLFSTRGCRLVGCSGSQPAEFADVSSDHWARVPMREAYASGVMFECGQTPLRFCPEQPVNRQDAAVYILRTRYGSDYDPPPATGTIFNDVPKDHPYAGWIEQLHADGFTTGYPVTVPTSTSQPDQPLSRTEMADLPAYRPEQPLSRAEAAVFTVRLLHGTSYTPPDATGNVFEDVPATFWGAKWIEQLHRDDLAVGSSTEPPLYRPDEPTNRAEKAAFLMKTMEKKEMGDLIFEVESYRIRFYGKSNSGSADLKAMIILRGAGHETGVVGRIMFYAPEALESKQDRLDERGYPHGHMSIAQIAGVIDMLRNEKPIYVHWSERRQQLWLDTSKEPVEGEDEPQDGRFDCDWSAVHDFQPPDPARLRVQGSCMMPTPGYKLALTRAEPQGINPRILLLNFKIEPPAGSVPQVITPTSVIYEEVTDAAYDQVTILPDGVTIDVEIVH